MQNTEKLFIQTDPDACNEASLSNKVWFPKYLRLCIEFKFCYVKLTKHKLPESPCSWSLFWNYFLQNPFISTTTNVSTAPLELYTFITAIRASCLQPPPNPIYQYFNSISSNSSLNSFYSKFHPMLNNSLITGVYRASG